MAGKSIGVLCPRGKISHADCRTCALDPAHPCQYTPDILESMRREELHVEEGTYSATQLLNCDRQDVLVEQIEGGYFQDVDASWPMLRGSMVHALMEKQKYPGAKATIREVRLSTVVDTSFGPFIFSGQPDLIVVEEVEDDTALVKVVDFKSTSEIGHDLTAAKDDHQMQINIYAWLIERCSETLLNACLPWSGLESIQVGELEIVYADMKKVRRFTSGEGERTDRGKMVRDRSKYDLDINAPQLTEHYANGKLYEILDLAPIRHLTNEQVEKWVVRRIEAKERAKRGEMPGLVADDKRWLCYYCPVKSACDRIESERASGNGV